MLHAAVKHKIPMMIGTGGGAGGEPHLKLVVDLVRDIAREDGLHYPMAVIHAEQDKADIRRFNDDGRMKPLARNGNGAITNETIDNAERIVGVMGPEPFMRTLDNGAQIVLGGRDRKRTRLNSSH